LNPSMSDSLLSSTLSDNSTMLAIKNDVKGLINEYKEAVDRLKAENATIHSLVAAKKRFGHSDEDYISNRYDRKKTNASVDYNRSPQRIISDKSINNYDTLGSQLRGEEMKRLEKYAELDKYIDELNRKKEENLQRLATVENRLHTIRRTIPDEDSGILKTSDLSKEDEKPVYHSSRKKEVLRENNLNVANKAHRSQRGGETNSKYIEYLKNIDRRENKNLSKPSEREKSYRSGSKRKVQNENINDSHVLEDEIGELNKEIEMIRNLLDSAMLQRKYQSK